MVAHEHYNIKTMDNRAQFRLEDQISSWKSKLYESMGSEEVEELESHLYDSIDELKVKGLDEDEAFYIAQKRLGTFKNLSEEYAKVKPSIQFLRRLKPLVTGMLLYMVFASFNNQIIESTVLLSSWFGVDRSEVWFVSVTTSVVLGLAYILSFYLGYKTKANRLKNIFKIPTLIVLFVALKGLNVWLRWDFVEEKNMSMIGESIVVTSLFNVVFLLILLILSYTVFYKNKRVNKLQLRSS